MSKVKFYINEKKHYILDKNLNTTKNLINKIKILSEVKSYDILKDEYYGPKIYTFVEYLINQNVNITHMCNNLKSLNIEVIEEKNFPYKNVLAYYNSTRNKIVFNGTFNESTLYHELFHVASIYYSEDKTLLFGGFSYDNSSIERFRFGTGINEGYIDKLANEFFSDNRIYSYEQLIAEKLEKLVGKEELKKLYFEADLLGLINILESYEKRDTIYEFIKNVDYIYNINEGNIEYNDNLKSIAEKKLVDINQFLANCFIKKYMNDSNCFYKNKFELLKSLFDLPNAIKSGLYDVTFTINNMEMRQKVLRTIKLEEEKTNNKYKCKTKLIRSFLKIK